MAEADRLPANVDPRKDVDRAALPDVRELGHKPAACGVGLRRLWARDRLAPGSRRRRRFLPRFLAPTHVHRRDRQDAMMMITTPTTMRTVLSAPKRPPPAAAGLIVMLPQTFV